MLLDAKDQRDLSSWVETETAAHTDAEPSTLAMYVLALVQSDLPRQQLKAHCEMKLGDILNDATPNFVDGLFRAVDSGSYRRGGGAGGGDEVGVTLAGIHSAFNL